MKNTAHRSWVRVVGKRHDLQLWDMDTRVPPLAHARKYEGGAGLHHGEDWIAEALQEAHPLVLGAGLHLPSDDHSDAPFVILSGCVAVRGRRNQWRAEHVCVDMKRGFVSSDRF